MKVLCILNSNRFSGAENVVCQIIDMMKSEENLEIAYCSRDGEIREALNERNIKFIPLKKWNIKNLKSVIKEYKPDIIHAHDMYASLYSALVCGKIPLISHIHNNAYDSRGVSLKSIAYLFAAIKAKHIFWVSNSAFNGYVFHEFFKSKSEVLYNIVNIDKIYEKMLLDKGNYNYDVVFVGRLSYPKNPERLINVLSKVVKKYSTAKIAIVGTGELEPETKDLVKETNLCNNVDFLGFQSNPYKIMHDAKVMLITSRWEGTPMCVLEAMSLGLPIVSTPTDGIKDLIYDGKNGFLSDDDDELADAIIKIITEPQTRSKLSDATKEKAKIVNNIDVYKKILLKIYGRWGKV